jgi:hypothetical protein
MISKQLHEKYSTHETFSSGTSFPAPKAGGAGGGLSTLRNPMLPSISDAGRCNSIKLGRLLLERANALFCH